MCVIIDANVVVRVFVDEEPSYTSLRQSIVNGRHRLVHGGKLSNELSKVSAIRRLLVTFYSRGLSRQVPSSPVNALANKLEAAGACTSDDPHIIALATVGHVRVLCTNDYDLRTDFRNKQLIDKPRGHVYVDDNTSRNLVRYRCQCSSCRG